MSVADNIGFGLKMRDGGIRVLAGVQPDPVHFGKALAGDAGIRDPMDQRRTIPHLWPKVAAQPHRMDVRVRLLHDAVPAVVARQVQELQRHVSKQINPQKCTRAFIQKTIRPPCP
jgi:hypothetical protein